MDAAIQRGKAKSQNQGEQSHHEQHSNHHEHVATLPSSPKAQTAKDVIAANVKLLIEQLEAGHSEGLTAYLTAMGRFHNYSFGNILEIAKTEAVRDPRSRDVCVEPAWPQGQQGGEGHPHPRSDDRHSQAQEGQRRREGYYQAESACTGRVPIGLRVRCGQTERSQSFPDLKERVKGEVGEYRERLIDFIIAQGIELEFKESIAPALGMSYGGKIAILPGQAAAEEFGTLVHELATKCYTNRIAGPPPRRPFVRPRPRLSPLSSRRPSASTLDKAQPITSICTTATPHFWPRAWKSFSARQR